MKKYLIYLGFMSLVILFTGQSCVSLNSNNTKPTTSGPAGMFVSTDKGDTWKQISALPTADGVKSISGVSVYHIFEDPEDTSAMYLATRSNGLFYSYNDGVSWQHSGPPFSSGFIYSIAIHPKNKCIVYSATGSQVFKTNDCSRSWVEMYRESRSDVKIISLAFDPFFANDIIVAEDNGDLLKSVDEGKSWMLVNRFGLKISEIWADSLQQNVWYIITRADGLYRSTDGGTTWVSLKDKMSAFSGSLDFRRFLMNYTKPGVIYWISTYGILISNDSGDTWASLPLITPPGSANIYGFAVNSLNDQEIYYTATISDRSTFYRSLDGGKNWVTKKLPSGQIPTALRVKPGQDTVLYLGFTIPPTQ